MKEHGFGDPREATASTLLKTDGNSKLLDAFQSSQEGPQSVAVDFNCQTVQKIKPKVQEDARTSQMTSPRVTFLNAGLFLLLLL